MTIISVCGDPGGAKALSPVLSMLEKDLSVATINYSYHEGIAVLQQQGVLSRQLPTKINQPWIDEELKKNKTTLLLTATSHNQLNWEKFFIQAAKKLGIFSIAVLDFWSNYALRFSDAVGHLIYLPDKIAVMDQRAKDDMVAAGITAEHIMITGQPAFDSLATTHKNFSVTQKNALRAELKVKNNELLVMFVSQPLRQLYGQPNQNNYLGYDEEVVLKKMIHSLEALAQMKQKKITLLIRPHPRETLVDYAHYQSDFIQITVSMTGNSRDYLMSADLVVGMTSVLLVEACYLHCVVMSLQPGLLKTDVLPTNALGRSRGVYQEDQIAAAFEEMLLNDKVRQSLLEKNNSFSSDANAAYHIASYIQSMTSPRI